MVTSATLFFYRPLLSRSVLSNSVPLFFRLSSFYSLLVLRVCTRFRIHHPPILVRLPFRRSDPRPSPHLRRPPVG